MKRAIGAELTKAVKILVIARTNLSLRLGYIVVSFGKTGYIMMCLFACVVVYHFFCAIICEICLQI